MNIYQPVWIFGEKGKSVELNRAQYLASCVSDKKVLHVGCADAPISKDRVNAGLLLHQQLEKNAQSIIGIDIDEPSIRFLQDAGVSSIRVMDAEKMNFSEKFDVIIAGDIIEHLANPGLFLSQIPDLLAPQGQIIIGVPHAFSLLSVKTWLTGRESVHKDHCAYYSPKTLAQLCMRSNLLPTKLVFTTQPKTKGESSFYIAFRNTIIRCFPNTAASFVMQFMQKDDIVGEKKYCLC